MSKKLDAQGLVVVMSHLMIKGATIIEYKLTARVLKSDKSAVFGRVLLIASKDKINII